MCMSLRRRGLWALHLFLEFRRNLVGHAMEVRAEHGARRVVLEVLWVVLVGAREVHL